MIAWIRSYLGASKKLLAQVLALGVTAVVFAIGLMFVAGYLIAASADNAFSLLMLNIPLAFVQIFGLGKPLARYLERLRSHDWVLRLTSTLRLRLFGVVQHQQYEAAHWRTGEVLGSLASDIEHVQNLFLRCVFPVLIAWIAGVVLVAVAGCMSAGLLLFAFIAFVLLCVIVPAFAVVLNRARIERNDRARASLYAEVTDKVLGTRDIAIAGRGEEVACQLMGDFDRLNASEKTIARRDRLRLLLIQALLLCIILVLIWWTSARFGGAPGGTSDWIVAVALGFFPLIEVVAPLPQLFEDALEHREALERMNERGLLADPDPAIFTAPSLHSPFDITIEDLSFSYEPEHCILREVTLSIPYGQKLAVLGKSGSGKTTLAHLIHGDMLPSSGAISFAGVPVADLRDSIWDYVGFISQDSYVFAMSIFDNLRIGKIEVSEEEAWAALDAVGLKDHVASLPDKLETMADEAGLNFSGGQRGRLALARVLLQDPPIVVLDEPTVGLDPVTEQKVLDTIMRVFADKTLVMITHHLQGVEAFDRVLFVEEGRLIMDGSPTVLLRENARYAKLLSFDRGLWLSSAR